MARVFTVLFAIMCGGAAVGAKLHETAGINGLAWILASLALQAIALKMDG